MLVLGLGTIFLQEAYWKYRFDVCNEITTFGHITNMDIIFLALVPYFSIDNMHLMYNVHLKLFRHSFWCIYNVYDTN
jgi:hypothetical protein